MMRDLFGVYCSRCVQRQLSPPKERGQYIVHRVSSFWPFDGSEAGRDGLVGHINRAVPKRLPEEIRREVCQELAVACLDGRLNSASLSKDVIEPFIKAAFRMHSTDRFMLSLDYPYKSGTGIPLRDSL